MYTMFLMIVSMSLFVVSCGGQVLQFGKCAEVATVKYFDVERFSGHWYEIERFPMWYEQYGNCAFKRFQHCGRRVEIKHGFVRDDIQYVLHINSSYTPGGEAVFEIERNNIDPIGIPLTVISTDYENYAIVHGCKFNPGLGIKYIAAWILSRKSTLSEEILMKAYTELNGIPFASIAYLEKVEQRTSKCQYHWTANVQAESINDDSK